ncbi:WhiB family transcriptional regulator [Actinomadura sp. DC4]|uniref:WhiB family transcriptional regulator n=1 Tax=Actinomadura sp. DC4 TaxID=3055069 RepID=UPI0025B0BFE7|nr:WhiB family transcriptional regulator [Actinomadura sp. DC4]MDN3357802.1 WhiB family transcriptional regulator [Actinomadura sp. DC4]
MSIHPSTLALSDLVNERLSGAECVFDPELHDGPDPWTTIEPAEARAAREDVAKEVCASCPVRAMCDEYAARVRPERGVWAGRTAQEIAVLTVAARVA